jgi:hypothetical protein
MMPEKARWGGNWLSIGWHAGIITRLKLGAACSKSVGVVGAQRWLTLTGGVSLRMGRKEGWNKRELGRGKGSLRQDMVHRPSWVPSH